MNIPEPGKGQQRIVILGIGFAGLKLARRLAKNRRFQLVIIDKNNYHQFQPLLYQVATAGLEPSSISFPVRKIFQNNKNVFIRIAEIQEADTVNKTVYTSVGKCKYDKLIIALGSSTNYYGNKQLEENCIGLKTVSEALYLRNTLLRNYEKAVVAESEREYEAALNIVIVGGGPTGVELAGAIAEMRNRILPKEYSEIDFSRMNIFLTEAVDRLLPAMSPYSSRKAGKYLKKMGVSILLNTMVKAYEGQTVTTDREEINSLCVIWAAGMKAVILKGIPDKCKGKNNRILVNEFNEVKDLEDIYAIGDIALATTKKYPDGHPQLAPVANQQANNLAGNLLRGLKNKTFKPFSYADNGNMATVGRSRAVVELPFIKFGGLLAWLTWLLVHLMSMVGVRNRLFIFINWLYYYLTYNLSLRLIIKPGK
ncbi:MAG: NAD(P)/FAD-dependent oxidoreductase [Bacteroidota bacterium]